ncbi:MAG: cobalamin biosynthesis protein CobW, partial [Anaerolineae bacterium]|nr:cobalamin biosynthesis protein CobW [Anaerolineae bacterium]
EQMHAVLRSKGFFWIASRHNLGINWSLAGSVARVSPAGSWLASVPEAQRPKGQGVEEYIADYWEEPFGDRRQELVFIGIKMPKDEMLEQLNAALLTDAELALGEESWERFADAFPIWQMQVAN